MSSRFAYFPIRFDRNARVIAPGDIALRAFLKKAASQTTDLIVICHGWNNDMAEAENLYTELLANAADLLGEGKLPGLADHRLAVLAVLWPSKKFAESELIPGNAAGAGDRVDVKALSLQIDALLGSFDSPNEAATLMGMQRVLSRLKDSDSACEEFVKLARSLVRAGQPDRLDGSDRFFIDPPLKVFQKLGKPVSFTATALPGNGSGGTAGQGGSALGIGDLFSGVGSAARNVLNLITYYQMKERAGLIGATALNPLLRGIRRDHPALRLHLVGHSFGGRLVSATAAGASATTLLQAESMSLLQAAFSHYGFAHNWDQQNNDGVFRRVVEKKAIRGPLIITHTTSDLAVGMAYPLASLLAGQNASALGDQTSDYGGIGRNGAQKTPEAQDGNLIPAGGTYRFVAGRLHNLNARNSAGDLIRNHGDVGNRDVAYAVLSAIAAVPA